MTNAVSVESRQGPPGDNHVKWASLHGLAWKIHECPKSLISCAGSQDHVPGLKIKWFTGLWIQESYEIHTPLRVHRELEAAFQIDLQASIPVLRGEQAEHALWLYDLFIDTGDRSVP